MVTTKSLPDSLTLNRQPVRTGRDRFDPGLALIFVAYLVVSVFNFDFVPMWDGGEYTNLCVLKVADSLNPLDFNCFNHPSMAFMGLVGWTQIVSYGNMFLLHAAVAGLSLLSVYAFYKISLCIYPSSARTLGLYIITFCYAFFPIILGSAFNLNADQGMLIFLVLYIATLLYDRKLLAVLASTGLLFSKEPALLLYPLVMVSYFIIFVYRPTKNWKDLYQQIKQNIYLFTPIMVFAIYGLIRVGLMNKPVLWLSVVGSSSGGGNSKLSLIPVSDLFNPIFHSQLLMIFVIHFNWLITSVIAVAAGWGAVGWVNRLKSHHHEGKTFWRWPFAFYNQTKKSQWMIVLVFLGTFYVLTRFKSFVTPRYYLAIYPLLLLLLFIAYNELPVAKLVKNIGLVIIAGLLFWSNFMTVDPVSKAVYGTFEWGNHQLLRMTSITGECCGYGQDQLVYNLEYIHMQKLQNDLYGELRPDRNTVLATNSGIPFSTFTGQLDNQTYQRTNKKDSTVYHFTHAEDLADLPQKPTDIYFVEYPIYPGQDELNRFLKEYRIAKTKFYEQDGYTIKLHHLVRQQATSEGRP